MRISDWSSDVCSSDLNDAQVAGAGGDQPRDVVVAYQQQVDRQRLAVAEQPVTALAPAQSARGQQRARWLAETAGLLDGNAQTAAHRPEGGRRHGGYPQCEAREEVWRCMGLALPPAPRARFTATRPQVGTPTQSGQAPLRT